MVSFLTAFRTLIYTIAIDRGVFLGRDAHKTRYMVFESVCATEARVRVAGLFLGEMKQ